MLELDMFKSIVENASLVPIDTCLACKGKILMDRRNNQLLKCEGYPKWKDI
jgi:hypothetical protein